MSHCDQVAPEFPQDANQGFQQIRDPQKETANALQGIGRNTIGRRMILLLIADLAVTVAAYRHLFVAIGAAGDVLEPLAMRIAFSANHPIPVICAETVRSS